MHLRSQDKLPIAAAILVYTGRAALGIAVAASIVMVAFAFARIAGYKGDHSLGDTALEVWFAAFAVYGGCLWFAWYVDRKRGL